MHRPGKETRHEPPSETPHFYDLTLGRRLLDNSGPTDHAALEEAFYAMGTGPARLRGLFGRLREKLAFRAHPRKTEAAQVRTRFLQGTTSG